MSDQQRLDLGLLERALAQLKRALADYAAHPETEAYRDPVVIWFAFTYELCMQVMTRYVRLEHTKPVPESELTTPRIVRGANALGSGRRVGGVRRIPRLAKRGGPRL